MGLRRISARSSSTAAQYSDRLSISKETVMTKLATVMNSWVGSSQRECGTIKKAFSYMWNTAEAQSDPPAFAKMQLELLNNMNAYTDLRAKCLSLARKICDNHGEIFSLFQAYHPEKLIDLLAAKETDGTPGLYWAMNDGCVGAIQIYGNLLQLIPENESSSLVKLLAAKDKCGTPALNIALEQGQAEAIIAYGELLQLFPHIGCGKLVKLVAAKDARGASGILSVM